MTLRSPTGKRQSGQGRSGQGWALRAPGSRPPQAPDTCVTEPPAQPGSSPPPPPAPRTRLVLELGPQRSHGARGSGAPWPGREGRLRLCPNLISTPGSEQRRPRGWPGREHEAACAGPPPQGWAPRAWAGGGVCSPRACRQAGPLRSPSERGHLVWSLRGCGPGRLGERGAGRNSGSPAAAFQAARAEGETGVGGSPVPREPRCCRAQSGGSVWPGGLLAPSGSLLPGLALGPCAEPAGVPARGGRRLSPRERPQVSQCGRERGALHGRVSVWVPTVPKAVRRGN